MTHEPYIARVVGTDIVYVACRCGWGHLVGEDDFMAHAADDGEQVPEAVAS